MRFIKRQTRLPKLRRAGSNQGKLGLFGQRRGSEMPQITSGYGSSGSGATLAWILIGVSLFLLIGVVTYTAWLPVVASIVPDRYILAYAPEPLQQVIFEIDVDELVPTVVVDEEAAEELLADLPVLEAPTPTATLAPAAAAPSGGGGSGGTGYAQPTPFAVAETPTLTPVSVLQVDPRAADRENAANLSNADALLQGFNFAQQGYNNCGPASLSTMMSYWGVEFSQSEAANYLKPNPEDPNVRPDEMRSYIEDYGYQMIIRENGNIELLQDFVLAGYPVLIETGYDPEPDTVGWTSHFLTIVGYSDRDQSLIAMDTYRRPNWSYPYHEIDKYWRQFNRRYMVAYRPDQAVAVASIIGEDMDDLTMYNSAIQTAQFELSLDRQDSYAWFNLGTGLVGLGRYEEAATAFDQARSIGLPWRFLWYQFAPFEAYLQVGRYEDVIELADNVLSKKSTEEPFYYKGLAYLQMGDEEEAERQFTQAVRYNKNYRSAQLALEALDS